MYKIQLRHAISYVRSWRSSLFMFQGFFDLMVLIKIDFLLNILIKKSLARNSDGAYQSLESSNTYTLCGSILRILQISPNLWNCRRISSTLLLQKCFWLFLDLIQVKLQWEKEPNGINNIWMPNFPECSPPSVSLPSFYARGFYSKFQNFSWFYEPLSINQY